ncbi:60S ribosomal protein L6 [Galdieria sulphuraria]|uniref:60S ribosomal protein L6e n=1 Tax=Galdieria sulphuraria TaxID=130081 RepID=M2VTU8_GALSU|nr:60S ribosomal protein L6e [Galdieria sulphuraria]EME26626.1 60S ribosomal protein L6e [Galdieria sulphuraria]GJD08724.1 60S ribosomal protein L6 [Galdieria sulphuraria]|eukprot:XP_005703146.1 60S ribosomal protein L6e [Galdieria sulphuraria]
MGFSPFPFSQAPLPISFNHSLVLVVDADSSSFYRIAMASTSGEVQQKGKEQVGQDKEQSARTSDKITKPKRKWYPADDEPRKRVHRKKVQKPTKLRASITPGTVLILLSGRFRGRRVIFLKQLASGLLLVTGPYSLNGVPMRRVNQRYVIATRTKVDIQSVEIPAVDDDWFKKNKKKPKTEEMTDTGKTKLPETFIKAQQSLDSQLVPLVKEVPFLKSYLCSRFSLSYGQFPHEMRF